jgi:hypothetical protein
MRTSARWAARGHRSGQRSSMYSTTACESQTIVPSSNSVGDFAWAPTASSSSGRAPGLKKFGSKEMPFSWSAIVARCANGQPWIR